MLVSPTEARIGGTFWLLQDHLSSINSLFSSFHKDSSLCRQIAWESPVGKRQIFPLTVPLGSPGADLVIISFTSFFVVQRRRNAASRSVDRRAGLFHSGNLITAGLWWQLLWIRVDEKQGSRHPKFGYLGRTYRRSVSGEEYGVDSSAFPTIISGLRIGFGTKRRGGANQSPLAILDSAYL